MRANYEISLTPQFRVLSDNQIEEIFYAALDVLSRTGARVYGDEALSLLREAGCLVVEEQSGEQVRGLARIPAWLVKQSLSATPSQVIIAGRDRRRRLTLQKDQFYFGTGSDCPTLEDPYTGEMRKYSCDDIYNAARISDALDNIDFHMSLGLTSGVTPHVYDRHQFLAMLRGTSKPFVITSVDRSGLLDQYKMACEVLGGPVEFSRAPLFVVYIEPSSPLSNSIEAVEKLLYAAEKGIPAIYTPCIMCGGTGPATMAGSMVQALAEYLVGVVLAQSKRKGAAVIMGGVLSPMDMATSIMSYGAPELALVCAAMTDVAKWLRVPMFSAAGCSDAKVLDEQAAIEASISITLAALSGANLIHDVGFLESALLGSFDMLVMSDEIIAMAKRIMRGIRVTPGTLAAEEINQVGPGGHYLTQEHTRSHFRTEMWVPSLMDRQMRRAWEAAGAQTMAGRIRVKVRDILESHEPQPIPSETVSRLHHIVAQAEARYSS
jgi:trimethylamine--corrinoid protein Co-methyltransferase